MYLPLEVVVLFAAAVVLLLVALALQHRRAHRRPAAVLRPIAGSARPGPDPGPHVHLYDLDAPSRQKGYWREYDCTVPGCRSDPLTMAGAYTPEGRP